MTARFFMGATCQEKALKAINLFGGVPLGQFSVGYTKFDRYRFPNGDVEVRPCLTYDTFGEPQKQKKHWARMWWLYSWENSAMTSGWRLASSLFGLMENVYARGATFPLGKTYLNVRLGPGQKRRMMPTVAISCARCGFSTNDANLVEMARQVIEKEMPPEAYVDYLAQNVGQEKSGVMDAMLRYIEKGPYD